MRTDISIKFFGLNDFPTPTVNFTIIERAFHNFIQASGVGCYAMKQAYVVKLGEETNPSKREFVGCVD